MFEVLWSDSPCFLFLSSGKSKEAEIKRINKELANIRSKFKGDKALDGYSKKKYVCKLLFIFLLGHDIDFGHMEAVNLLSSNKYTEKQIVSEQSQNILLCVVVYIKFLIECCWDERFLFVLFWSVSLCKHLFVWSVIVRFTAAHRQWSGQRYREIMQNMTTVQGIVAYQDCKVHKVQ